jgi:DNA repair photolyase
MPPQKIYMESHSDPYQPLEMELQQTRKVLEILHEKGFSASIFTN